MNVFGCVLVTQAFLGLLRSNPVVDRSKRIVFISSGVGKITMPNIVPYCATKHALESIGDGFRLELAPWNMDVVIIEPGAITSGFRGTVSSLMAANLDQAKQAGGGEFQVGADVLATYVRSIERSLQHRSKQSSSDVVVEDVLRGLLEKKPLTRYLSGNDSRFGLPMLLAIPDRVRDLFVTRVG